MPQYIVADPSVYFDGPCLTIDKQRADIRQPALSRFLRLGETPRETFLWPPDMTEAEREAARPELRALLARPLY